MSVKIFALQFPSQEAPPRKLALSLPAAQQKRLTTLGEKRARTFVWTRAFLQWVIGHATNSAPDQWLIEEHEGLPPSVQNLNKACAVPTFSISHSADLIVIATLSKQQRQTPILGVDVEKPSSQRRLATARYFCNSEQTTMLDATASSDRVRLLTQLWTQKEAWFKARHTPVFNAKLRKLDFDAVNRAQADVFSTQVALDTNVDFLLSICTEAVVPPSILICQHCSTAINQAAFTVVDRQTVEWSCYQSRLATTV